MVEKPTRQHSRLAFQYLILLLNAQFMPDYLTAMSGEFLEEILDYYIIARCYEHDDISDDIQRRVYSNISNIEQELHRRDRANGQADRAILRVLRKNKDQQ